MQVRSRCCAGAADIANRFTLFDALTSGYVTSEAGHVCIQRRNTTAVLEHDDAAITAVHTRKTNATLASRFDRRTRGCGIIDATVSSERIKDRVTPRKTEVGTDACEVERGAQKLPSHATSVRRKVITD